MPKQLSLLSEIQEDHEEEEPSSPCHFAGIRSFELAKDTPAKWLPELSEEQLATWRSDDPIPVRFERALRLLVNELKRQHKGGQTFSLENGRRIFLEGIENPYRFPWKEDEHLFEGASVEIIIDGRKEAAKLVSIKSADLILATDADFGFEIRACELRIDNTAFIVALADRMKTLAAVQGFGLEDSSSVGLENKKHSKSGPLSGNRKSVSRDANDQTQRRRDAGPFNSVLAEGVLSNSGPDGGDPVELEDDWLIGLNKAQCMAVKGALSSSISYIWGPPGTGKTRTLSVVLKALLHSEKRTLICSNTNQAVDQVLAKLCETLSASKNGMPSGIEALEFGRIVRVGPRDPNGPLAKWDELISIESIARRKTKNLHDKIADLEKKVFRIERDVLTDRKTIQLYRNFEKTCAMEADEKRKWEIANATQKYLGDAQPLLPDALIAATQAREAAEALTQGLDLEAAQRTLDLQEGELADVRSAIGELRLEIEKTQRKILAEAKIIGVTATKLFLSPQAFESFTAVIIDEASMLMLPALYNAAGFATERVIVSGDFRQLSPIVPTNQRVIRDELGRDIFSLAGIERDFDSKFPVLKNTVMLDEQYRMVEPICRLISDPIYGGRLRSSPKSDAVTELLSAPLNDALTIVDTSSLGPVAGKNARSSWINLMSGLVVRDLCKFINSQNLGLEENAVGVIVPYSGQRKLLEKMLTDAGLRATVGTVHRYQGAEKRIVILDLVDGFGRPGASPWYQADLPTEDGVKLLNVAISRAQQHLIVVGDLVWLDRKLPASSMLRHWLYQMQTGGNVVPADKFFSVTTIARDLDRYGVTLPESDLASTGIFDEREFLQAIRKDISAAREGIAIWSAFVTLQGVTRLADLLRARIHDGVKVRCVVRPPEQNGSMGDSAWREGVRALEAIGAVVDIKGQMHEKVILIDKEIVWHGSLNLLSHAGQTREIMLRIEGSGTALEVASFLSAFPKSNSDRKFDSIFEQENPLCPACGGRTRLLVEKQSGSRFWKCSPCGWTLDPKTGRAKINKKGPKNQIPIDWNAPAGPKP